jgi:hypothetical protein
MDVDPRDEGKNPTEEQNPTQQLGFGSARNRKMDEDDKRIESDEPRAEVKPVQKHVAETIQQTKEQVQVEDVTGEPDSDAEEEEEAHQEAGHPL